MSNEPIVFRFTTPKYFTRWPCTVSGGCTDKVNVLTEAETPDGTLRICESALREGDIDGQLTRRAEELETHAQYLRTLIGRLQVPTYAEWEEAERLEDEACAEAYRLADEDNTKQ